MFKDYTLQTTKGMALIGLAGGVWIGALIVASFFSFSSSGEFSANSTLSSAAFGFIVWLLLGVWIWGLGILFAGVPVWFVLHKAGFRTWPIALTVGFILPFIIAFIVNLDFISEIKISIWAALGNAAQFGLLGLPVALTIWHIAYWRPAEDV